MLPKRQALRRFDDFFYGTGKNLELYGYDEFNHIDFLMATDVVNLVYNDIVNMANKYKNKKRLK